MWPLFKFQYGFRSSQSTADLLPYLLDGATQPMTLDISKTFGKVLHAGLSHKLESYRILGQLFGIFHIISVKDSAK